MGVCMRRWIDGWMDKNTDEWVELWCGNEIAINLTLFILVRHTSKLNYRIIIVLLVVEFVCVSKVLTIIIL
jgi:hypothetical protein